MASILKTSQLKELEGMQFNSNLISLILLQSNISLIWTACQIQYFQAVSLSFTVKTWS